MILKSYMTKGGTNGTKGTSDVNIETRELPENIWPTEIPIEYGGNRKTNTAGEEVIRRAELIKELTIFLHQPLGDDDSFDQMWRLSNGFGLRFVFIEAPDLDGDGHADSEGVEVFEVVLKNLVPLRWVIEPNLRQQSLKLQTCTPPVFKRNPK
jgi:hypothetical protein